MKILFICDSLISLELGNPSRIYNIEQALRRFGICTDRIPSKKILHWLFLGQNRIQKYLRRVYLLFCLIAYLSKKKVNCIYSIDFYMGLEAVVLAKLFKIKTIYDFGGYVYEEEIHRGHRWKPLLTKLLEKLCLENSTLIVTQTIPNKELLTNYHKKVLVLENGVNLDEFPEPSPAKGIFRQFSIPDDKPIVGFVGNWENWMKIEDFLNASKHLENVTVVVIGEGKGFREFKTQFKDVYFTGRIPHRLAMSLLINFDICVAPYSKDGIMRHKQAMKTLEYLAAGKPIIVSDVIGRESFLKESENCLLYEPENPEDMAQKISQLLQNKELRAYLSQKNKELAMAYAWEKTVARSGLVESLREMK